MKKRRRSSIVPAVVFSAVVAGVAAVPLLGGCDSGTTHFTVAVIGFDMAVKSTDMAVQFSVAMIAFDMSRRDQ